MTFAASVLYIHRTIAGRARNTKANRKYDRLYGEKKMADFEQKEFLTEAGEEVSVRVFEDDTVAVWIDGEPEWAGKMERAGVIVAALVESGLLKDE